MYSLQFCPLLFQLVLVLNKSHRATVAYKSLQAWTVQRVSPRGLSRGAMLS